MSAKSDYLENALVNHVLRNVAYTSPATVYVALFTTTPTEAGVTPNFGGVEVSGGSYVRVAATFGAPSGGSVTNSGSIAFPSATTGWGTITHFAIIDASTGGNMLYYGALTTAKTVASGDLIEFLGSTLTIAEL